MRTVYGQNHPDSLVQKTLTFHMVITKHGSESVPSSLWIMGLSTAVPGTRPRVSIVLPGKKDTGVYGAEFEQLICCNGLVKYVMKTDNPPCP